jgi:hypothetical protein
MAWKVIEIWRDHTYRSGKNEGATHRAFPLFSVERNGYDIYPSNSNKLASGEIAKSLDEVYEYLSQGKRVRCIIPATGEDNVLKGNFIAVLEQE